MNNHPEFTAALRQRQIDLLVFLSPLPCIPILWIATHASFGIVGMRGFQSFQHYVIVISTVLGWLGCIGLMGGGVRASYSSPFLRNAFSALVACGYVAILVVVTGILLTFAIVHSDSVIPAEPQRVVWPLVALFALLSWPVAAGFRVFRYRARDSFRLREPGGVL